MSKAKKLPKKVTVEVTAKDITCGKRGSCSKCPVARGLRRALKTSRIISVSDGFDMGIYKKVLDEYGYKINERLGLYQARTIGTRAKVTEFTSKFDGRKSVKPFKFVAVLQDEKD